MELASAPPYFSITIPAYKINYLQEAIDSILGQTFPDFELLILNDASPDDIDALVYACSDPRIRYFKNDENVGANNIVKNWNKLLSLARGRYIICMGDDDKLSSDCLETYSKLIGQYPDLHVFHGRTAIIDENSTITTLLPEAPVWESVYNMIFMRWTGRQQFIGDFLFRTQTLREKGGYYDLPMAWASDDITAFSLAIERGCAHTQDIVFYYRRHTNTISRNQKNNREKFQAKVQEHRWFSDFLSAIPNDSMDKLYREQLVKFIGSRYWSDYNRFIHNDILSSPIRGFAYWMSNCRQYQISRKHIVHIVLRMLKEMVLCGRVNPH